VTLVGATAKKYNEALAAFKSYIDTHPKDSIDERTAELNKLVSPILASAK